MNWFINYDISSRSQKQIENIDYLINNKKYLLARREIIKLLNQYPNFWEIGQRLIVVNHRLDLEDENIKYLKNVLTRDDSSGVKSCLFECYYYMHQFFQAFELLDYFMDKAKEFKIKNYRIYEVILMMKLGMNITLLEFEQDDYILRQIINYDKDLFLKNAKKQFNNYYNKGYSFNQNFNLELLCSKLDENIDKYQRSKELSCYDIFHINYPNMIWNAEGIEKKEILVKTIPETNEIITIQPVTGKYIDNLNDLEIDLLDNYKSSYQKKKKTQIEKFYSRYHK